MKKLTACTNRSWRTGVLSYTDDHQGLVCAQEGHLKGLIRGGFNTNDC